MAQRTRYYRMTKPDGTDLVNIDDLNGNFDIIDEKLKEHADGLDGKIVIDHHVEPCTGGKPEHFGERNLGSPQADG